MLAHTVRSLEGLLGVVSLLMLGFWGDLPAVLNWCLCCQRGTCVCLQLMG